MERIDHLLAHLGYGTRKDIHRLISRGSVTVNGTVVKTAACHIDPVNVDIAIDGQKVAIKTGHIYLMHNKVRGTICAVEDHINDSVFTTLGEEYSRYLKDGSLHIVGRLDKDTEGLLILTTDGAFTHRLISPKSHIAKTYAVSIDTPLGDKEQETLVEAFANGVNIAPEGDKPGFISAHSVLKWSTRDSALLTLYEGKYHEVKRLFHHWGYKVVTLKRLSIGGLVLNNSLSTGGYRELTQGEIALLEEAKSPF